MGMGPCRPVRVESCHGLFAKASCGIIGRMPGPLGQSCGRQRFKRGGAPLDVFRRLSIRQAFFQPGAARIQFRQRIFNIIALLFKRGDTSAKTPQITRQGLVRAGGQRLEIEHFADFLERETDPATPQDQGQTRHITGRIPTRPAPALGIEQAFLLVKAQGARRDIKLLRDLADGKISLRDCSMSHGDECMPLDVNVNVNLLASM